jgi:hypothetical protein
MKTKIELIGRKRIVKLVTGLNYYSEEQVIPVLGELPSKKINPGDDYSNWGLYLGLRYETINKISVDEFTPRDYNIILFNGNILNKDVDY